MLKSNQKKADQEESNKLSDLKKEFEQAKQKTEVNPQEEVIDQSTYGTGSGTRRVKLRVGLECGCGGGWTEIEREVDFDSPLQDNDIVADFDESDYVL